MPHKEKGRVLVEILLLAAVYAALVGTYFAAMSRMPLIADEKSYHFPYIYKLIRHFDPASLATPRFRFSMLPTYHYLAAVLERIAGGCSIARLRGYSVVTGFLCVLAFYFASRQLGRKWTPIKTLQLIFLPLLVPFYFLIYTETLSLFLVLAGVALALRRRVTLSGICAIASIAIRQSNAVWALFTLFLIVVRDRGEYTTRPVMESLRRLWIFIAGLLGFGAFVVLNGGISTANRSMVPSFHFYAGNLHFALFCLWVLFLPVSAVATVRLLWERRRWLAALLAVSAVAGLILTFKNNHPYNQIQFFLRNQILIEVDHSGVFRTYYGLIAAGGLLAVLGTPLLERSLSWLYLFSALFLMPNWLIEPRYYLIPFALFLLFRKTGRFLTEVVLVFYSLLVSVLLIELIRTGKIFI